MIWGSPNFENFSFCFLLFVLLLLFGWCCQGERGVSSTECSFPMHLWFLSVCSGCFFLHLLVGLIDFYVGLNTASLCARYLFCFYFLCFHGGLAFPPLFSDAMVWENDSVISWDVVYELALVVGENFQIFLCWFLSLWCYWGLLVILVHLLVVFGYFWGCLLWSNALFQLCSVFCLVLIEWSS